MCSATMSLLAGMPYTTLNKETLEAPDTSLDERKKLVRIAWYDTTPEADIDPTLPLCSSNLLLKAASGRCRWYSVERHVNDCCYAATGSGLCTMVKSFPFGSSWLVEMNMRINKSGQNYIWSMIDI